MSLSAEQSLPGKSKGDRIHRDPYLSRAVNVLSHRTAAAAAQDSGVGLFTVVAMVEVCVEHDWVALPVATLLQEIEQFMAGKITNSPGHAVVE